MLEGVYLDVYMHMWITVHHIPTLTNKIRNINKLKTKLTSFEVVVVKSYLNLGELHTDCNCSASTFAYPDGIFL